MANKNFILMSMEDTKIKKISNVISNDSCRRILDYLAEKEATESEIAKKLSVPISTVHYNLQQLIETGLIVADEYHYSEKGKEVLHYKLANKYIIIAPKSTFGLKEKLKSIFSVGLISIGAAGIIQLLSKFQHSLPKSSSMALDPQEMLSETQSVNASNVPNTALWFLLGALFALSVYFIIIWIRERRSK